MTYKPSRDHRYEYVWEVMSFVEERQCHDCAFKNYRPDSYGDYFMCGEIELELMKEGWVEALDDHGDDGVVCTKYRNEVLVEQEHPDQGRLF